MSFVWQMSIGFKDRQVEDRLFDPYEAWIFISDVF